MTLNRPLTNFFRQERQIGDQEKFAMLFDYIVNNVLRVYAQNQLDKQGRFVKFKDRNFSSPDKNNLSQAKRKVIIEGLSQTIGNQLIDFGPQYNIERDEFKLHPEDYRARLAISKNIQEGLIFKEIDENGETANVLSIEDSRILRNRLEEIPKKTVNKNLI